MNPATIFPLLLAACVFTASAADSLQLRVELAQDGTNFYYTVFNDEPAGASTQVYSWHLELFSPFQVTGTPEGWAFDTDNASYINWFSTDSEEPFPHDIPPGSSLSGFAVAAVVSSSEDLPFSAGSWLHGTTNSGPSTLGIVQSPSVQTFAATITNLLSAPERFQFSVLGVPSLQYTVEISDDLLLWTPAVTKPSPFTFQDTLPAFTPARFFRVSYDDPFGRPSDPPE